MRNRCEICERLRKVNRLNVCRECWKAQDLTRGEEILYPGQLVSSFKYGDLIKGKSESIKGCYNLYTINNHRNGGNQ